MELNGFVTFESVDPPVVTNDYKVNQIFESQLKSDKQPDIGYIDLLMFGDEQGDNMQVPGLQYSPIQLPQFSDIPTMQSLNDSLNKALDRNGITGIKRKCLIQLAKIESGNNPKAKSKNSSACGLFQMIDSTRESVSSVSKSDFLNSIDEQVKAASRLYDKNLAYLNANGLMDAARNKGISADEAVAMTWLNPTWTKNWLSGKGVGGSDANGTNIIKYLQMYRSR